MGKVKKARKFANVKKMIKPTDIRLKKNQEKAEKSKEKSPEAIKHLPQVASSLFFQHNKALGPPYHVIIDTNFFNKSIQNKLDIIPSMMDCLYAVCIPYVTDCVLAEIEKLGPKFRLALQLARDSKIERLPCLHSGTYADDCILQRVTQHRCFIIATNDKQLKQRIRKIPGIPIMYVARGKYAIERLPDAPSGNFLVCLFNHEYS